MDNDESSPSTPDRDCIRGHPREWRLYNKGRPGMEWRCKACARYTARVRYRKQHGLDPEGPIAGHVTWEQVRDQIEFHAQVWNLPAAIEKARLDLGLTDGAMRLHLKRRGVT